jgi:hypothetical protein
VKRIVIRGNQKIEQINNEMKSMILSIVGLMEYKKWCEDRESILNKWDIKQELIEKNFKELSIKR